MNTQMHPVAGAVQIRPLAAADAPAYKVLRDEALRTAPDAFTSDYESSVGRDAREYVVRFGSLESGQFFLGAFDAADQLVGCLGCEREQRTKQRHCAVVVGMMVSPRAQRQGIGQQLVAACVQAASRVSGLTQLVLTVTASNTHVVRLYEQAGFRAWGLLPNAIVVDGVGFDKLHMVRVLHD
ncbi:MAG: GNAT family N-acetyltransferase [Burkholderiaceae bacterium]|nr:GNAT family N-acetyltransferase [Burkholderiaceae bacterium]